MLCDLEVLQAVSQGKMSDHGGWKGIAAVQSRDLYEPSASEGEESGMKKKSKNGASTEPCA